MDFKIGAIQVASINRYHEVQRKTTKPAALKQEADKVDFSESKTLFSQALEAAKASPDIRGERVATVKTAIQNGTYQVDSQAIARRILGL